MTMGRPKKGTIERHGDHWDVRPTLADGTRGKRLCQPPEMSEARARDKAAALTAVALRLGKTRALSPPPAAPPCPPEATITAWSARWCDDRETRGLASVDDDRGRLRKWIIPVIGHLPVATFVQGDLERLVEKLDQQVRGGEMAWKTAKNIWGLVTKACDDMVRAKTAALRVRTDNPAKLVRGPDEGVVKAKAYLYPAEFLALVTCERVPIRWRRLFALNVYTYTRAGELEALGLEDIDLAHRVIHVHRSIDRADDGEKETKTNCPRKFAVETELLPLLDVLTREAISAPRLVTMPPISDLSNRLRKYLRWAGVSRAELFANDATRKQITFHDLRATGITWMAIRGDDPQRIMHRAGHENMATTMGYIREAEALDYLKGDVFPALPPSLLLPGLLPEGPAAWAKLRKTRATLASPAGFEPGQSKQKQRETSGSTASTRAEVDPLRADNYANARRRAVLGQNHAEDLDVLVGSLVMLGLGRPPGPALEVLGVVPGPMSALELAEAEGDLDELLAEAGGSR